MGSKTESIAITIQDIYRNETNLNITVSSMREELFKMELGNISVRRGSRFEHLRFQLTWNDCYCHFHSKGGLNIVRHHLVKLQGNTPHDAKKYQRWIECRTPFRI